MQCELCMQLALATSPETVDQMSIYRVPIWLADMYVLVCVVDSVLFISHKVFVCWSSIMSFYRIAHVKAPIAIYWLHCSVAVVCTHNYTQTWSRARDHRAHIHMNMDTTNAWTSNRMVHLHKFCMYAQFILLKWSWFPVAIYNVRTI